MLEQFDKEVGAMRKELLQLCWFMRGGLSFDEAVLLSPSDRVAIREIVEDNFETTKKSGLPYF